MASDHETLFSSSLGAVAARLGINWSAAAQSGVCRPTMNKASRLRAAVRDLSWQYAREFPFQLVMEQWPKEALWCDIGESELILARVAAIGFPGLDDDVVQSCSIFYSRGTEIKALMERMKGFYVHKGVIVAELLQYLVATRVGENWPFVESLNIPWDLEDVEHPPQQEQAQEPEQELEEMATEARLMDTRRASDSSTEHGWPLAMRSTCLKDLKPNQDHPKSQYSLKEWLEA